MKARSITRESKAFDLYKATFKKYQKAGLVNQRAMSRSDFHDALIEVDKSYRNPRRKVTLGEISFLIHATEGVPTKQTLKEINQLFFNLEFRDFLKMWAKLPQYARRQYLHEYFAATRKSAEEVYEDESAFDEDETDDDAKSRRIFNGFLRERKVYSSYYSN